VLIAIIVARNARDVWNQGIFTDGFIDPTIVLFIAACLLFVGDLFDRRWARPFCIALSLCVIAYIVLMAIAIGKFSLLAAATTGIFAWAAWQAWNSDDEFDEDE
jgi:hypothetical protein